MLMIQDYRGRAIGLVGALAVLAMGIWLNNSGAEAVARASAPKDSRALSAQCVAALCASPAAKCAI